MKKIILLKILIFFMLFFVLDFCVNAFLVNGLDKYYGLGQNTQIAIVGHSHLMLGLDKKKMEKELKIHISKYTREGVNVQDRYIMTKQLLASNANIKTVIYGVDAWTFTGEGLSTNSYKLFYPFMDDSIVDSYVAKNSDKIDYIAKKVIKTTRYNELLIGGAIRGHLGKWGNFKYGQVEIDNLKENVRNGNYKRIKNANENIYIFKKTLGLFEEHNVNVILLYVPTIDLITNIQLKEYNATMALFEKISEESNSIDFLNLQEPWSKKHKLFYDPIHLNPDGQELVTNDLIDYLRSKK